MSTGNYVGFHNEAHSIIAGYVGVDDAARKIVKAYVGVDGKARLCWKGDSKAYLEFTSPSSFTISMSGGKKWDGTMEYDTGAGWTTWTGGSITSGQTSSQYYIRLRGTANTVVSGLSGRLVITGSNVECDGNVETLLDYFTVESGGHPTMGDYCFCTLFSMCSALISPPDLPSTQLAEGCYQNMFNQCSNLSRAPELPATGLFNTCYTNMFNGCTALTTAPALPATTLAEHCYEGMFYGCTSLITAPTLPATTLASLCYANMFKDCTALTTAPALPATTLATYCYSYMFQNCTKLAGIPALPATTLPMFCYRSMFDGCTAIKLSASRASVYTKAYRIPETGTGVAGTSALDAMFDNTGGTFTGTPSINTTYYLHVTISIV